MEFSIRNKRTHPIVTFKRPVLDALLAADPEASSLVLSKRSTDYQRITGLPLSIDHEQQRELLKRYGADDREQWTSRFSTLPFPWFEIERTFVEGFMARSTSRGVLKDLEVASAFYAMLDRHFKEAVWLEESSEGLRSDEVRADRDGSSQSSVDPNAPNVLVPIERHVLSKLVGHYPLPTECPWSEETVLESARRALNRRGLRLGSVLED
jgi:hypothetical protein